MQTDELGRFVRALRPKLSADERSVALEIYKGLAASGTISIAALSERTGLDPSIVEAIVSSQSGVFRDARGDIVGFWGLTAQPVSNHVLRIDGQTRYAWCAWDCLFIPGILGQSVQVKSVCPQTGTSIQLIVSPRSVEQVRPASTVLSALVPDLQAARQDVVANFCHFVHFFKDSEAASEWTASRPGTGVISLDEGLELGRMKNEWQYGEAL